MKPAQHELLIIGLMRIILIFAFYSLTFSARATQLLTEMGISSDTPFDVVEYIKMTLSDDPIQQIIGAKKLGLLGKKATPAIPFLIQLNFNNASSLQNNRVEMSRLYEYSNEFNPFEINELDDRINPHYAAGCALRAIGSPAFKELIEILQDKNEDVEKRRSAAWVFMDTFQLSMKDIFIKLLSDEKEDNDIKESLISSLGLFDDDKLLHVYNNILKDKSQDNRLRYEVLCQLGMYRKIQIDDNFLNTLHVTLDDKNENNELRAYAGYVLAIHADNTTIDYLSKILLNNNENNEIRANIAEGMVINNSNKANNIAVNIINSKDNDIKKSILIGMGISKKHEYENIIINYSDSSDKQLRMYAIRALFIFNSEKTINKLLSILKDPKEHDYEIIIKAAECLAKIEDNEVVDRLFDAQSYSECAHYALLHNLKKDEHLLKKWIETLNNKKLPIEYRRNAVTAIDICNNGSEKGPHALAKSATDEDKEIRKRIAFVLGRIGTKDEIPVLEVLAKNKEVAVSDEAKEAINKLKNTQ